MRDDPVDADAFAPLAQQPEWADLTPLPLVRARLCCVCVSSPPPRVRRRVRPRAPRQVEPAGAVCQPGPLTEQWTVRLRTPACTQRAACTARVALTCDSPAHPSPTTHRPPPQEAHAYFRAVRARSEVSPRARQLTALLIALNPADYTAWAWRCRCVAAAAEEEEQQAGAAGAGAAESAGASFHCGKRGARLR